MKELAEPGNGGLFLKTFPLAWPTINILPRTSNSIPSPAVVNGWITLAGLGRVQVGAVQPSGNEAMPCIFQTPVALGPWVLKTRSRLPLVVALGSLTKLGPSGADGHEIDGAGDIPDEGSVQPVAPLAS